MRTKHILLIDIKRVQLLKDGAALVKQLQEMQVISHKGSVLEILEGKGATVSC